MNACQQEQHQKAGAILVSSTAKELNCGTKEVFRLACALAQCQQHEYKYEKFLSSGVVPEDVYDFCLDILVHRIEVLPRNRKAKKRDKLR